MARSLRLRWHSLKPSISITRKPFHWKSHGERNIGRPKNTLLDNHWGCYDLFVCWIRSRAELEKLSWPRLSRRPSVHWVPEKKLPGKVKVVCAILTISPTECLLVYKVWERAQASGKSPCLQGNSKTWPREPQVSVVTTALLQSLKKYYVSYISLEDVSVKLREMLLGNSCMRFGWMSCEVSHTKSLELWIYNKM